MEREPLAGAFYFFSKEGWAGKSISKGIMESMTLLADTKEKAVGA